MNDYQAIREQLISLQSGLESRMDRIVRNITHADTPLSRNSEEQAQEQENLEVVDALGNATRTELHQVKQAIKRIDTGQYGYCSHCDQSITIERLHVLPYTDRCINCAE